MEGVREGGSVCLTTWQVWVTFISISKAAGHRAELWSSCKGDLTAKWRAPISSKLPRAHQPTVSRKIQSRHCTYKHISLSTNLRTESGSIDFPSPDTFSPAIDQLLLLRCREQEPIKAFKKHLIHLKDSDSLHMFSLYRIFLFCQKWYCFSEGLKHLFSEGVAWAMLSGQDNCA